ncbi:MAG: thioredoxin family protein [Firmicutes bacterium]|nr:thioredoxin family protein [Bacillota bacterium]
MLKITDENFEAEIKNYSGNALLEFYSDSCIPCKRMSPVLAEIDEKYSEIKTAKYNVNTDSEIAKEYKILASPTIIFFKGGEEKTRRRGIVKKDEIEEIIKEVFENESTTS